MELDDSASKQLGIRWDSLEGLNVAFTPGPFAYDRTVTRGESRDHTRSVWDTSSSTDSEAHYRDSDGNVLVEQEYEYIDLDNDGTFTGAGEIISRESPTTTRTIALTDGYANESDLLSTFTKTVAESQSALLEVDTLNFVLSALKQTEGVSVISNPKMIVTSGDTNAIFSVGSREPIIAVETAFATSDGSSDRLTAELDTEINTDFIKEGYLETGISLQVIPVVKTDDLIEAYIAPSLRTKTAEKVVGENSWPIIRVKEIRTTFTLSSGQTVAIGGLTDTTESEETSKVPLLGDIPLLGKYLFSHTSTVKSQVETIIFVTLSLAEPTELSELTGGPEGARLVHKKLIKGEAEKAQFDAELEVIREETEKAMQDPIAADEEETKKSKFSFFGSNDSDEEDEEGE